MLSLLDNPNYRSLRAPATFTCPSLVNRKNRPRAIKYIRTHSRARAEPSFTIFYSHPRITAIYSYYWCLLCRRERSRCILRYRGVTSLPQRRERVLRAGAAPAGSIHFFPEFVFPYSRAARRCTSFLLLASATRGREHNKERKFIHRALRLCQWFMNLERACIWIADFLLYCGESCVLLALLGSSVCIGDYTLKHEAVCTFEDFLLFLARRAR